jgi:hypothetical protein
MDKMLSHAWRSAVIAVATSLIAACSGGGGAGTPGNSVVPAPANPGVIPQRKDAQILNSAGQVIGTIPASAFSTLHYDPAKFRGHTLPLVGSAGGVKPMTNIAYPDDMHYLGGRVYTMATEWDVYVNCQNESCWGRPEEFQKRLNGSTMIHVLDQYVGATGNGRYTFGGSVSVMNVVPSSGNTFSVNDILTILQGVVNGTSRPPGYSQVYHVFLPSGYDTCEATGICYSPDNTNTWVFCAYHSSVTLPVGHVIFSVEPYQNVNGCNTPEQNPAYQLEEATGSTLSHEFFESQSDPDPGSPAWNDVNGFEIGDDCRVFFENIFLNGGTWLMQMEYSNTYHACADGP